MTNTTNTTTNTTSYFSQAIDATSSTEYYPFLILTVGFPLFAYFYKDKTLLLFSTFIALIGLVVSLNSDVHTIMNLIHMVAVVIGIMGLIESGE